ncbi:transcription factor TFIID complex subunit 8 C-term-domain-containing protein [Lineolata rhizophorae]|uniref:Transcription initiation factor TFIID subunit 8 n=1 Tax=Lineolata rhizophorae TaxID=578093 RepID=A0A6A6P482_9PEZI|nr:transcription factor TFIID complex subunit 8 C-term-domain-containing protein [Lineolata rhizophorae]
MASITATKRSLSTAFPEDAKAAAATVAARDQQHYLHQQKKRTMSHHHALRHRQSFAGLDVQHVGVQDEAFYQSQVIRGIGVAMSAAGFDGATAPALETVRGMVDEFMSHFLDHVRASMLACRRTTPIPHDFAYALAAAGLAPSDLLPHLSLPIPPEVAQPPASAPAPEEPAPPPLDNVLGPELVAPLGAPRDGDANAATKSYVPAHFPNLPSMHTWQSTPVFSERETDPRVMRERATAEGVLAEQALRKLMAAGKHQRALKRAREDEALERELEDELTRGENDADVEMGGVEGVASKQPTRAPPKFKRRDAGLSARQRQRIEQKRRGKEIWEETLAEAIEEDEKAASGKSGVNGVVVAAEDMDIDMGENGRFEPVGAAVMGGGDTARNGRDLKKKKEELETGVLVNYEQKYWRQGARKGLMGFR